MYGSFGQSPKPFGKLGILLYENIIRQKSPKKFFGDELYSFGDKLYGETEDKMDGKMDDRC